MCILYAYVISQSWSTGNIELYIYVPLGFNLCDTDFGGCNVTWEAPAPARDDSAPTTSGTDYRMGNILCPPTSIVGRVVQFPPFTSPGINASLFV